MEDNAVERERRRKRRRRSSVAEIFFSCSLVADAANVAREPRDEPDERGDLGRLLRHAGKQQAAEQVDAGIIAAFFVGCLL